MTDISKAEHDKIVAQTTADAVAAGVKGERERILAILALGAAKGFEATALHLALTTDISAAAMPAVLAGLIVQNREEPPSGRTKDAPGGLVVFQPKNLSSPDSQVSGNEISNPARCGGDGL